MSSITNAGKINFLGFVDIAPMVTFRVPEGGSLTIGKDTAILQNTFIHVSGRMVIGEKVLLNRNCYIACMYKIEINDYVMMADCVSIHDNDHQLLVSDGEARIEQGFETHSIIIEKNVWLASKVTILKGVVVGFCSVVAAGGVVTKDVPRKWLYAGVPAKPIKQLCN